MANEWHLKWLKEGVQNWNLRRKRVKFTPDFAGVKFFDLLPPDFREDTKISAKTSRYFEKIDLSSAILEGADLSDLNFRKANFAGANLSGAALRKTNFTGAKFDGANLTDADLSRSTLNNASFIQPVLSGAIMKGASILGTLFVGANLSPSHGNLEGESGARVYRSMEIFKQVEFKSPTSELVQGTRVTKFTIPEEKTGKNRYEVFYGTNREPVFHLGKIFDYSGKESINVSYGICAVTIPEAKPLGKARWIKRLFNRSALEARIAELYELNPELFFSELGNIDFGNAPTIFVHGYNTSFTEAVKKAAEIGRDLGVSQAIGLFSWPSLGRPEGYLADESAVLNSRQAFAQFISDFSSANSNRRVNIIAHSMGCRLLSLALEELSSTQNENRTQIDNVILAAADIDQSLFLKVAKKFTSLVGRTTSYICDSDKALMLSSIIHQYKRVGHFPPVFSLSSIDTVKVGSDDFGILSHNYLSGSRAVLGDIFYILDKNFPPNERHALVSEGGSVWRMRA